MKVKTVLALAATGVVCLGPAASGALAAFARVDTSTAGVVRLLYTERTGLPTETNNVTITQQGTNFIVHDTAGVQPGNQCPATPGDPNTVTCNGAGVTVVFVDGGAGDDKITFNGTIATTLRGGEGDDTIIGGDGPDRITSNPGKDIIDARGGNDSINSQGQDADNVTCGPGIDMIVFDKFDTIAADCETGTPPGGNPGPIPPPTGPPPIAPLPKGTPLPPSLPPLPAGVPSTIKTGACQTSFVGTAAADRFDGTNGPDREFGLAGNDLMRGGPGDDCLFGAAGNDRMLAGPGTDLVVGDKGNDRGAGGTGNDTLFGNGGRDRLNGGPGTDKMNGGPGNDRMFGGSGGDRIKVAGGRNVVFAGPGSDTINARNGKRDLIVCGGGIDSVRADFRDVLRGCERVTRGGRRR